MALAVAVWLGSTAVAAATECPYEPVKAYRSHCARCHGQDGRSDTTYARTIKVEPLADDRRLAAMSLAELVKAVKTNDKHGLLVHVDDDTLQCAAMYVMKLAKRPGTRTAPPPTTR